MVSEKNYSRAPAHTRGGEKSANRKRTTPKNTTMVKKQVKSWFQIIATV
jgi:hypothetical protein